MRRFAPLVLLAACASSSSQKPLPAAQPAQPGPLTMTRAELDARLADHRLQPVQLERVGSRDEISPIGDEPWPEPPEGTLFTSACVPGGAGDVVLRDERGWLYVVSMPGQPLAWHGPDGQPLATPATRCFRDTWRLPDDARHGGVIEVR